MASISNDPNGRRRILFVDTRGDRKTIRLGKVPQRYAEAVKVKVEDLVFATITGHAPADETSRWLTNLGPELYDKLARVGLTKRRDSAKLGAFLTNYIEGRSDVKPATREVWSQVVRNLLDHFGDDRALPTVTEGDAEDFKMFLIAQGLAPVTVHKRLQFARMFFRGAKRRELITNNPFEEITNPAVMLPDRQYFVTRGETERLLAESDSTWRVIVGLCRYGGLRCPSEVLSLRWQDVNWESEPIIVPSPKTAHHPGKDSRIIPMFAELKPILAEAFDLAPEGAEYVVDSGYRRAAQTLSGWRNCNMRTQFMRIVKRAGLKPWPRLFHAMRGSRETELAKEYPIHVVTSWLGNTVSIAVKHYLQVTDDDFARASGGGAESGAQAAQNTAQHTCAGNCMESPELTKTPIDTEFVQHQALVCATVQNAKTEREGFEPSVRLPAHRISSAVP